jgi:hypothetical protein
MNLLFGRIDRELRTITMKKRFFPIYLRSDQLPSLANLVENLGTAS